MRKKILATSTHPGAMNAIIPVIKRLSEKEDLEVSVIGYKYSEKVLENQKIKYKTIKDYNLNDISVESMDKILQNEHPDLILTGASSPNKTDSEVIEQKMIYAARKMNIKSLAVMDFFVEGYQRFSDFNEGEAGKFKYLPDKITTLDKLSEEIMLNEGFPKEKLAITGNPYFDELAGLKNKFNENDRKKLKNELGIDMDSYLFFYMSQPIEQQCGNKLGYTEKDALREFLDSFKDIKTDKKFNIIVKAHLRENQEDLEKIAKEYNLPVIVDQQKLPLRPVMFASDAVISPWSTMLIESTYLEKPSISLQPGLNAEDPLITNKLGITVPVYKHGEMKGIVEKLLNDKNYNIELSQMGKRKGFSIDGKATERVTNLVYEMLNTK